MFTKIFALMMAAATAALSLEVVFGVHLGIGPWMHRVFEGAHIGLPPL